MPAKKNNRVVEILEKIVVPVVVAIISAGTTYLIATRPSAPPAPGGETRIEELPVHIFAFAGNNNPEGGWSAFDFFVDPDLKPVYMFQYSLPTDGSEGYAGLTFKFEQGADLSEFRTLSFLLRIPTSEEIDLVLRDIAGKELRYRLKGGPQSETQMDIALSNFKDLNLKAVREVMLFADTGFVTGGHTLSVKDMKLVR
jgi:hypothetical protein